MTLLENEFNTIKLSHQRGVLTIQLCRPEANNSIDTVLVNELMKVLNLVEPDSETKVIVIEGLPGIFCTGMDFDSVRKQDFEEQPNDNQNGYYNLLKHFSSCSKIIISKVEGKVNAGGIGIVAASDIVISNEIATFGLSEALFGLLPACVLPFLIRRVGFQKAQWMTFITQGISVERAFQIGLVDEVSNNPNEVLRKTLLRLTRLETEVIKETKDYMESLWIINKNTQDIAIRKLEGLIKSERVQFNIKNFVDNGKFPWDKSR